MPTTEQLRSRLLDKLKELFQLNQPDLDFGFYRILHAKAEQVTEFIDKDLLKIIEDSFGTVDASRKAELQAAYDNAIQTAKDYGAPNPEEAEQVKKAKAALEAFKDNASAEADIYDHLYRFFERYYHNGDFISLRYYSRETSDKAAPYVIPYNGEEVKLHWANADQYYIKTAEYFSNYTFDLWQTKEIRDLRDKGQFGGIANKDTSLMRVHFRIAEATEGEHGNVKTSDNTKRYFIIHADKPVEVNEDGELVINFEYRPDPEKSGKEKIWQEKRSAEALETVLSKLAEMKGIGDYLHMLKVEAPIEKDKKRSLLAKYINKYTARNSMDYFIHKDLSGFLRRELDFYIKNEVMRLDDIENADAPAVEVYLSKIKVLRKIAHKLIYFMAQLEDFQKKLWLKKKFVVETNYCITLDRIPEELYKEIAANVAQHEEWIKLFAIDEIKGDLIKKAYSKPLTVDFLKFHPFLVLDTKFFTQEFKDRLISSIDNLDEQCNGLLIHSENFQALNILQERYRKVIKSIYTDPPYNTSASEIVYKNSYKHSSWLCLLDSRIKYSKKLLKDDAVACYTIDDFELDRLKPLLSLHFGGDMLLGTSPIRNNPSGRSTIKGFSIAHEYALYYGICDKSVVGRLDRNKKQLDRYDQKDEKGAFEWVNFRKHGGTRSESPKMFYPFFVSNDGYRIPKMSWDYTKNEWIIYNEPKSNEQILFPIDDSGQERRWKWGVDRVQENPSEFTVRKDKKGNNAIYLKARLNDEGLLPLTWWDKKEYSATAYGTNLLKNIFQKLQTFTYPKSIYAVIDCLKVCGVDPQSIVIDYFAGSGTTGHAVINLNREDNGNRKFILIEMGEHFNYVLKPRIQKVIYSKDWKSGKPVSREGSSHMFKYLHLESYEDTLNNLRFDDTAINSELMKNASLKEDYMLHYLLDVETRGSQSLLNIDAFVNPTAYSLKVKNTRSDEYTVRNVDLIESFNYLIGLRVNNISVPRSFSADFKRVPDPELPEDQYTRLTVDGRIKQDKDGHWSFRKIEGWVPADPENPNNGLQEKVLIVWRKLTEDLEKDNLMLDEWFLKNCISPRDFEFNTIYVNGSNNLPNLKQDDENWKVRLIEEEFMKRMWDVEDV